MSEREASSSLNIPPLGDVEAQLIRSNQWHELKSYYLSNSGNSWALFWITLKHDRDEKKALEYLRQISRDSRYEAAASILMMKLMPKSKSLIVSPLCPKSFQLFSAYLHKSPEPLLNFLKEEPQFSGFILERIQAQLTESQIAEVATLPRTPEISFLLGEICSLRLSNQTLSHRFYREFYADPWSRNIVEEIRRILLSEERARQLRHLYAQKNSSAIRKWFDSFLKDLRAVDQSLCSKTWKSAIQLALQKEIKDVDRHLSGYSFWQDVEWSPAFVDNLRRKLFPISHFDQPEFVTLWKDFLDSESWKALDFRLGPMDRALWQINVEIDPHQYLSEALLKFPDEERFLVLWAARRKALAQEDRRLWPQDEKESQVVRKNLERAFDKAENKLVWFDRLRKSGCSQSFYEHALSKVDIPLEWVVSDLEANIISPSPEIRAYLTRQASINIPGSNEVSLKRVIHFLTPAETQEALVSRFIISEIPEDFLTFEIVELLWDARERVPANIRILWERKIGAFLLQKQSEGLSLSAWNWFSELWDAYPEYLDEVKLQPELPWKDYLEVLHRHRPERLVLAVSSCPLDELKLSWLPVLIERDDEVGGLISALPDSSAKFHWKGEAALRKGFIQEALKAWERKLEEDPVINEQLTTAERALDVLLQSSAADYIEAIGRYASFLDLHGRLSRNLCFRLTKYYEQNLRWPEAWRWAQQTWIRSQDVEKEESLESLLQTAFGARVVSEAQRILIDFVFKQSRPSRLIHRVLSTLLASDSDFKIQYLRKEFIEKSSQLFPLHRAILRERSTWDYRAWLLWQAFYGENLERHPDLPRLESKRMFSLWGLVHVPSQPELFSSFLKYFDFHPQMEKKSQEKHEFLESAIRILRRAAKLYGSKSKPDVILVKDAPSPLKITTNPMQIIVDLNFFGELDEEIWHALCVGAVQIFEDRREGLFEERRVVERFFHGMMIAGVPIVKLIRFWVWLAMSEQMIEPAGLQQDPEGLVERLPFMNALLIFYLSKDMELKLSSSGLLPC